MRGKEELPRSLGWFSPTAILEEDEILGLPLQRLFSEIAFEEWPNLPLPPPSFYLIRLLPLWWVERVGDGPRLSLENRAVAFWHTHPGQMRITRDKQVGDRELTREIVAHTSQAH